MKGENSERTEGFFFMQNVDQQVQETAQLVIEMVTVYGLDVLGAIAILIIGWWFAGRAKAWSVKAFKRTKHVDDTLTVFLGNAIRYLVLIITVLAVLDRFGVETTSFIAILGATSLAIGLALQGTLSNVAAGVMLLFFRPFSVGNFIEGGGQAGTVKSIGLFVTHMNTPDNVEIIVPNSALWGSSIKNFSFNKTRRCDFVFGIGYGDDIDKAMSIIAALAAEDERVHKDPEPMIVVGELGDSSVNIITRLWCDAGEYWNLRFHMLKAVKQRFDAEGISIPFPQRDVHLYQHPQD
jgi:small conductance mechanosensitive channel